MNRVYTRFPPEPNGYLHIGHAKAMFVDFGFAEEVGGSCYLRYDDTNPSAEKKEYIDHIQEIVAWLGWKPFKITYSSDYFQVFCLVLFWQRVPFFLSFLVVSVHLPACLPVCINRIIRNSLARSLARSLVQELYELAVKLIKRGKAYVCHQTGDEIKEYREKRMDSPWRNRSIEENLRLFEKMKKGLYAEGEVSEELLMPCQFLVFQNKQMSEPKKKKSKRNF